MQIIYKANDGTLFDHEQDCLDYEWRQEHPEIEDLVLTTSTGEILSNIMSEYTYGSVYKIVVPDEHALAALHKLADYTGYENYFDIDAVGTWAWALAGEESSAGSFKKVDDV